MAFYENPFQNYELTQFNAIFNLFNECKLLKVMISICIICGNNTSFLKVVDNIISAH